MTTLTTQKNIQHAFSSIVYKWNGSHLESYQFLAEGRINIVFRLIVIYNHNLENFILKIYMSDDSEFWQGEGKEFYLEKLLKLNSFSNYPKSYIYNNKMDDIPYSYEIMEEIRGGILTNMNFNIDFQKLGFVLAQLHKIKVKSYGKDLLSSQHESADTYYANYFLNAINCFEKYNGELATTFLKLWDTSYEPDLYKKITPVLIHHDVHAHNIFIDKFGYPILIDWDSARGGIKEYDFIKLKYLNTNFYTKDQKENILKGYLSIANLNFDKNFILYELCWLARMYIFEMKHPYYGQYFPNKEFYYENFINLSTQVEDKSNFYKNYPDKFFEGVIANEY